MREPFDVGLQPERTLLAWRRTCLALGLASAVIVRFAAAAIGLPAVFLGLTGIAFSTASYILATTRYRRVHRRLHHDGHTGSDGRALLFMTLAVLVIGTGCVLFIVGEGLRP